VPMPKKLLLAEDSLTIRKVFELALFRSDIAITAVDNGDDAVRLAGELLPDLVVADLTLPGKNGFEVASELRAMEKTENIPVLILSGTLIPLDEARFKASRARGVLFKPFESRELLETIERLFREEAQVAESPKSPVIPAVDERWDFSDVMDEVEAEAGKSAATAPVAREGVLPGAILPLGGKVAPTFNEFDVSIEEIDGGTHEFSPEPPPPASAPKFEHVEHTFDPDSPPPVTDLSPALDDVEEIEDIDHLEDVEVPMPPVDTVSTETPASIRILSHATAQTVSDEPVPAPPAAAEFEDLAPGAGESAVAEHDGPEPLAAGLAAEDPHGTPPETFITPPDAGPRPGDAELREFFAGRAEEIFRTVASEVVEKVMWEMTDRLAAEFSAKLRESVEAVAWEVIPSTAETLIREEIARIRRQAGKPSP